MRKLVFVVIVLALINGHGLLAEDAKSIADEIGLKGGVIIHVGCGDGTLMAELGANGSFLIQGLDSKAENITKARQLIESKGLYGRLSVDQWSSDKLPYIDNFANLIIVEKWSSVSKDELLRVLCPNGVAIKRLGKRIVKIEKPRPEQIDDWTHYMYDSTGNAVAHDTVIGPPRRMQWVGSPKYSRHHDRLSSMTASVSAGGKIFYIFDEAPPVSILTDAQWSLIARDAFNGAVLWKRGIDDWFTHLWGLKSGPAQLPRRLVAEGNRVYITLGYNAPLEALDAGTGQTVIEYKGTAGCEEIILSDGVLFAQIKKGTVVNPEIFDRALALNFWDEKPRLIKAIVAETGKELWSKETVVMPGTLAADSAHLVYHDGQRILCLDRKSGEELWKSEAFKRSKKISSFYMPTLVIYEDVVLFSGGETAGMQTGSWYESGKDTMSAFDLKTGKELWTAYHPPSGYKSPEDMMVLDGLVWTGETTSGRAVGVFTGRDVRTGEVIKEFSPDVDTYWFHHRCHRGKATDNFLLTSRAGVEFIDVEAEHWDINHWVRGACLYGIMPANGLLYAPQHPCACYLEAKMDGFNALAAGKGRRIPADAASMERLEKGPAYGKIENEKSKIEHKNDWPTYRGNPARSGYTNEAVPAKLTESWQTRIGGKLTSPVIAGGKVFIASIDKHKVFALDASTGKELWNYSAGGRVDSPPTIYKGLVLFGSADGYIYALRASDGQLAWKFLAAPMDERLMAFEQIESVWPVHGSVLIQSGELYTVAGRNMFIDDGLRFWRLDPATGAVLSETVLNETETDTDKKVQDYISWLNMPVARPDVLSSDGKFVYMRSQPFDLNGTRHPLKAKDADVDGDHGAPPPVQEQKFAHLFSPTGFLDDTNWHRTYWMYGSSFVSGWQGYYRSGKASPAGKILVMDEKQVYSFGRLPEYFRWTTPIEHQLFASSRQLPEVDVKEPKHWMIRINKPKNLDPTGKALTVEAWVKSTGPNGVILSHGGDKQGYALYQKGGRPFFSIRENGKITNVLAKTVITGRWAHVAGVLTDDGQLRIYVDGEQEAVTKGAPLLTNDPVQSISIGAEDGSAVGHYESPFSLTAFIDEVRVYHRALGDGEIKRIAQSETSLGGNGAVCAYSFDDGKADDITGNRNDGQIDGAVPAAGKIGKAMRFNGGTKPPPEYVVEHEWAKSLPLFVRAMLLAGDTLFIAGPEDMVDEEEALRRIGDADIQKKLAAQTRANAGEKGAILWAVSKTDGQKLSELKLASPPVFDGMAAAKNALYISCVDGNVRCLK